MRKHWKTLVASACVAAFAVPAVAQNAPQRPPEGARPWHGPHGAPGQAGPRGFSKPSERVEASLAYQKTALKITDAQQPQWNAYAEQVRKEAREMDQRMESLRAQGPAGPGARPGQPPQRPGAIEGLERRQAMHAEAIRRINDRLAVQKPLYAALNPEQQKIADMVLNPRGHMAMAHMGAMGGRGHFGGGMGPERGMRGPMMRGEGGMPGPMFGALEGDEGMHEHMARGFTRS